MNSFYDRRYSGGKSKAGYAFGFYELELPVRIQVGAPGTIYPLLVFSVPYF